MNGSNATGLAGGGALIAAFSLLTPWYVLDFAGTHGLGKSGAELLGGLVPVALVLAFAAGWSGAQRLHPWLPVAAAVGLALIVIVKLADPPTVADELTASGGGTGLGADLANAFAQGFASSVGLGYATAWGIWVAAAGAGATVVGTVGRAVNRA
jgi:hypothetical protein